MAGPHVSHFTSLGLTQLELHHLTEMSQWQLDCDQNISSVNTPETEQYCFCWTFSMLQHSRNNTSAVVWRYTRCRLICILYDLFSQLPLRSGPSVCALSLPSEHSPLFSPCLFASHSSTRPSSSVVLTHPSVARCGPSCCTTTAMTPPPRRGRPGDCRSAATIKTSSSEGVCDFCIETRGGVGAAWLLIQSVPQNEI